MSTEARTGVRVCSRCGEPAGFVGRPRASKLLLGSLLAALLLILTLTAVASANVSFIKAYGWGVVDGASQFETCTSTCQSGIFGGGAGQLPDPSGVATDSSGDVYVADSAADRIDEFSAAGAFIKAYGWGVADGASQFETCTSTCQSGIFGGGAGQLAVPSGVATDSSGDVYVADQENDRIDEFSAAGAFIKAYGWGVLDGAGRFETCTTTTTCQTGIAGSGAGQLYDPSGVATDSSGDVYIADEENARVDEFSAAGAFIKAYGSPGSGAGQLDLPSGVATDPSGDVYVADSDNARVDEFSSTGGFIRAYGWGVADGAHQWEICTTTCQSGLLGADSGEFNFPEGVATDSSGDVYVAVSGLNNSLVDEFSSAGGFIRAWGWGVSDGQSQFETCTSNCQTPGIEGGGAGQLYGSVGAATNSSGDVYVADSGNERVDEFAVGQTVPVTPPGQCSSATVGHAVSRLTPSSYLVGSTDADTARDNRSRRSLLAVTPCSAVPPEDKPLERAFAGADAQQAGHCMAGPQGKFVGELYVPQPQPTSRHRFWDWWCGLFSQVAVADYDAYQDPPDPSFGVVFQPKPFAVSALGPTCPSLSRASCRRLRAAELRYLRALANVASLSEAVAVTANRFGGAKDAGDIDAESLQSVAEAKYLPRQANAVRELRLAGRRFGTVLKRDHINTAFTAKQVAHGRMHLRKLDGIPRSLIARLERDGLITSRKDLERIIASLLTKEPRARATTLAQVLEM